MSATNNDQYWLLVGTAIAIVVATMWQQRRKKKGSPPASSLAQKLQGCTRRSSSYWLTNVRIPIANVPTYAATNNNDNNNDDEKAEIVADPEGLVLCHVQVEHGRIQHVTVVVTDDQKPPRGPPKITIIDAHGCLALPCAIDVHTHLIKTQTVPRRRNATGSWNEALETDPVDAAAYWHNATDIQRRMDFAVQCAAYYGTKALRTHLDGCDHENPVIRNNVYRSFTAVRQKYQQQQHHRHPVQLQAVANLYLPLWMDESIAKRHIQNVQAVEGIILGAYVGHHSYYEALDALEALFGYAQRLGQQQQKNNDHCRSDVDLHLDESNDPDCCALEALLTALPNARSRGYQGRVVLGHVCSLSLQPPARQAQLIAQLASQHDVYVVMNPVTNVSLQDRRGSAPPMNRPIDAHVPRTPQWRGLTAVQELRAAGVPTAAATDNVRDGWYAYGDYDAVWETWRMALLWGHLDTAPTAGHWADLITEVPAAAMGLLGPNHHDSSSRLLDVGQPADLILFPTVRRVSELLARPPRERIVLRRGQVQDIDLPSFEVLDDLMVAPTKNEESW